MTRLIFILLTLLLSYNLNAQDSWVTMLPDYGEPCKMIKSNDGGYLLLAAVDFDTINWDGHNSIGIYKFNNNGVLVWNKKYKFNDTTGHTPTDILQYENGDILSVGKDFCLKTTSTGDSIFLKQLIFSTVSFEMSSIVDYSSTSFLLFIRYSIENKMYPHLFDKNDGILLEKDTNVFFKSPLFLKKINNNKYLLTEYISGSAYYDNNKYKISFIDSSCNYLQSAEYYMVPAKVALNENKIIIHQQYSYSQYNAYYDNGLIIFNNNLDSVTSIPFSYYYNYGGLCDTPSDIIITSDDGYAMCGVMEFNYQHMVYLFKTDSLGNWLIIKAYQQFVVDKVVNVIEETDGGFVMFQSVYNTNPKPMFIVRTNPDGTVNSNYFSLVKEKIKVFPNPVNESLTIELSDNFTGYSELFNLSGQKLFQSKADNIKSITIDMKSYPTGNYLIKIFNNNNQLFTEKLIKY
ncbi:MAG: T9SS type A sorting domain-containing protein [Bacteroidia bacterium]|nr:T9SS type A sorting domain-containing protein [Bacteroidia bacterium]